MSNKVVTQKQILSKLNRKERGHLLTQNKDIQRTTDGFKVPSQTQEGKEYIVNTGKNWSCTCHDHQKENEKCKHIWAVELILTQQAQKQDKQEIRERAEESYSQNWTAYNHSQTHERKQFLQLLSDLTQTIENQEQSNGRPRKDLGSMIFHSALKVYTGFSLRRYQSLQQRAKQQKLVEDTCAYNTISHYLQKQELTEKLEELIYKSASPLTTIETEFAVDSSGFSTSTFGKYFNHKHGEEREVREWIKAHLISGTRTNIVTGVELTKGNKHDSPQFKPLVEKTAEQFNIEEVSADKAYNSRENYQLVEELDGEAYIPFRKNSTGRSKGCKAWKKMYHKFQYQKEEFRDHYHKRSNSETVFHMIKEKFGEDINSKKHRSQLNETLLKILNHNIAVTIQQIHQKGIKPEF